MFIQWIHLYFLPELRILHCNTFQIGRTTCNSGSNKVIPWLAQHAVYMMCCVYTSTQWATHLLIERGLWDEIGIHIENGI